MVSHPSPISRRNSEKRFNWDYTSSLFLHHIILNRDRHFCVYFTHPADSATKMFLMGEKKRYSAFCAVVDTKARNLALLECKQMMCIFFPLLWERAEMGNPFQIFIDLYAWNINNFTFLVSIFAFILLQFNSLTLFVVVVVLFFISFWIVLTLRKFKFSYKHYFCYFPSSYSEDL